MNEWHCVENNFGYLGAGSFVRLRLGNNIGNMASTPLPITCEDAARLPRPLSAVPNSVQVSKTDPPHALTVSLWSTLSATKHDRKTALVLQMESDQGINAFTFRCHCSLALMTAWWRFYKAAKGRLYSSCLDTTLPRVSVDSLCFQVMFSNLRLFANVRPTMGNPVLR